ncbi:MAG: hypothetical protein ACYDCE_16205 [Candidatus Acidiferrales bacterium]
MAQTERVFETRAEADAFAATVSGAEVEHVGVVAVVRYDDAPFPVPSVSETGAAETMSPSPSATAPTI